MASLKSCRRGRGVAGRLPLAILEKHIDFEKTRWVIVVATLRGPARRVATTLGGARIHFFGGGAALGEAGLGGSGLGGSAPGGAALGGAAPAASAPAASGGAIRYCTITVILRFEAAAGSLGRRSWRSA